MKKHYCISQEFTTALRAKLYSGLQLQIAKKAKVSPTQVHFVLNEITKSGPVFEKVVSVGAKMVEKFEKDNGIGPGRPVQGE